MVNETFNELSSFKKYNTAVSMILGYMKKYDELINIFYKEKNYYKDEIIYQDYNNEDLKAIIMGTFNDYEIDLINIVYHLPYKYKNIKGKKYDLLIDFLKSGDVMFNQYHSRKKKYCLPTRKDNYEHNHIKENVRLTYNILCEFEDKYKPKDDTII
jgi:hypothetical protein